MTAPDGSSNRFDDVDLVPAAITRAAEAEMRRCLPVYDDRVKKKHKTGEEDYVHLPRYDYSSAQDLEAGVVGFIVSCGFRR
jgi:hypothetical protein